ncbi:MAG: hypothetical protein COA96_17215 [SAR86 cluster bacterium]|uniref:Uncharacterized protein n=1 Tax=SAR86 cluster bacterium TaxID=2030880 RepID=A0A2A5AFP7_9GAMM|nr:MAG: hypothetical protein COA96_17215 [SAR86 cluster bacterium]
MDMVKSQKPLKPRLVLFVGPGNSGSTSVGLKIASDENGIFVGESLQLLYRTKVYCRCGEEAIQCEHIRYLAPFFRGVGAAEKRGHLMRLLSWLKMRNVVCANKDLALHCHRLASLSSMPVVDSSKDFVLAIVACSLSKNGHFDLRIEFPRRRMSEYLSSCRKRFPNSKDILFAFRYCRLTIYGYLAYFFAKLNNIETVRYRVESLDDGLRIGENNTIKNYQLIALSDSHYISGSVRLSQLLASGN